MLDRTTTKAKGKKQAGQHTKKQVEVVVSHLHKTVKINVASHFLIHASDWQVKRELKRAEREVDEWRKKGYTMKGDTCHYVTKN